MSRYRMNSPYDEIKIIASWRKINDIIVPGLVSSGVIEEPTEEFLDSYRPMFPYQKVGMTLTIKDFNSPEERDSELAEEGTIEE